MTNPALAVMTAAEGLVRCEPFRAWLLPAGCRRCQDQAQWVERLLRRGATITQVAGPALDRLCACSGCPRWTGQSDTQSLILGAIRAAYEAVLEEYTRLEALASDGRDEHTRDLDRWRRYNEENREKKRQQMRDLRARRREEQSGKV